MVCLLLSEINRTNRFNKLFFEYYMGQICEVARTKPIVFDSMYIRGIPNTQSFRLDSKLNPLKVI